MKKLLPIEGGQRTGDRSGWFSSTSYSGQLWGSILFVFCCFLCVVSCRTSTWWRDILLQNSVGDLWNAPLLRWLWNLQGHLLLIFLHLNACLSHSLCSTDVPTKSYALKPCLTYVFKQTTHKTWGQGSFLILDNPLMKWYCRPYKRATFLPLLLSHFSRVRLCATPETAAHQAPPSLGFSRQEHWSGLPFPSPMHESEKWKLSRSVLSDPQQPHGLQPSRLLRPWDFPGKSSGVRCHCFLHSYL